MKLHLCLNCLQPGAEPFPVGHQKGNQHDPFFDTIDLCEPCRTCLQTGDFEGFRQRYDHGRWVTATEATK